MLKNTKDNIVCIIQARLDSTRLPNKVMRTVGGIPMVKRVWLAAIHSNVTKVRVAWPERYPDLDENDVLERFRRVAKETGADIIVRLTADCPLVTAQHIDEAIEKFDGFYYSNHKDGYDVQVFSAEALFSSAFTNREHVFNDVTPNTGLSVNTKEDLERVRNICKIKSS